MALGAPLKAKAEFDLLAVAKSLKQRGRHRALVGQVERALSICSAHEDLRAAVEALEALRELTKVSTETAEAERFLPAIAIALTAHAIILYCRATQTRSNNRRNWFGPEILDDEQLTLHKQIKTLRDDAIAHFGLGEAHPEGALIKESIVLTVENGKARPIFYSSWILNKAKFTAEFLTLAEAVRDHAQQRASARLGELLVEVAGVGLADPTLADDIKSQPFDSKDFFLREANQTKLRHGLGEGQASSITTAIKVPFHYRNGEKS